MFEAAERGGAGRARRRRPVRRRPGDAPPLRVDVRPQRRRRGRCSQDADAGIGVRALVGSGWGFFAVPRPRRRRRPRAAGARPRPDRRGERAGARPRRSTLVPAEPVTASLGQRRARSTRSRCRCPTRATCWSRATDDDARARRRPGRGARTRSGTPRKWFVSSEGHRIDQHIRECGAGIIGHRDRRRRDAAPLLPGGPRAVRHPRLGAGRRRSTCAAHAARVGRRRRGRCSPRRCARPARPTLILGGEQLALQIHESVGHAIELDRILGWEAAYAGTSWLDLAQLGLAAVRLRADEHHHRPDDPGRARLVRLRRRGHPGRAARRGARRHLGRRARRARLGRGRRARLRRQRARRRLGPAADGADDQRRPRARARTRSTRSSPPPTTGSTWRPTAPGRSTTGG